MADTLKSDDISLCKEDYEDEYEYEEAIREKAFALMRERHKRLVDSLGDEEIGFYGYKNDDDPLQALYDAHLHLLRARVFAAVKVLKDANPDDICFELSSWNPDNNEDALYIIFDKIEEEYKRHTSKFMQHATYKNIHDAAKFSYLGDTEQAIIAPLYTKHIKNHGKEKTFAGEDIFIVRQEMEFKDGSKTIKCCQIGLLSPEIAEGLIEG